MSAQLLLQGRTAVITGGAGGIGRAMAHRFAAEGARIIVADLDLAAAEALANELPHDALAVLADVTVPEQVEHMVKTAVDVTGSLDVLVNNAGVTRDASIRKMTLEQWDLVQTVHLRAAFITTKAAAEVMREQQSGAIINMSSLSGKVGNFGQANYSAAKAGLVALTKVTAKEYARFGVRANAVQPGLIRTPMTEVLTLEVWNQKLAEVPLGRAGEPEEVANVALFLASDLSSYMTGAVLEVGGGRYM
jgi:3-oxoacyl-[acyl-carrier protein] reductase